MAPRSSARTKFPPCRKQGGRALELTPAFTAKPTNTYYATVKNGLIGAVPGQRPKLTCKSNVLLRWVQTIIQDPSFVDIVTTSKDRVLWFTRSAGTNCIVAFWKTVIGKCIDIDYIFHKSRGDVGDEAEKLWTKQRAHLAVQFGILCNRILIYLVYYDPTNPTLYSSGELTKYWIQANLEGLLDPFRFKATEWPCKSTMDFSRRKPMKPAAPAIDVNRRAEADAFDMI